MRHFLSSTVSRRSCVSNALLLGTVLVFASSQALAAPVETITEGETRSQAASRPSEVPVRLEAPSPLEGPVASDAERPVAEASVGTAAPHEPGEPSVAAQDASFGPDDTSSEASASDRLHLRGYGAMGVSYTRFVEHHLPAICIEGALIVDRRWVFGGAGCGVAAEIEARGLGPQPHDAGDRLSFGYAGFVARYLFMAEAPVSVSVGGMIGAGGLVIAPWLEAERRRRDGYAEGLFVAEPQVGAQLKVSRWMRLAAYAGYRIVSSVQTNGLDTSEIAGPVLGVRGQWGWF